MSDFTPPNLTPPNNESQPPTTDSGLLSSDADQISSSTPNHDNSQAQSSTSLNSGNSSAQSSFLIDGVEESTCDTNISGSSTNADRVSTPDQEINKSHSSTSNTSSEANNTSSEANNTTVPYTPVMVPLTQGASNINSDQEPSPAVSLGSSISSPSSNSSESPKNFHSMFEGSNTTSSDPNSAKILVIQNEMSEMKAMQKELLSTLLSMKQSLDERSKDDIQTRDELQRSKADIGRLSTGLNAAKDTVTGIQNLLPNDTLATQKDVQTTVNNLIAPISALLSKSNSSNETTFKKINGAIAEQSLILGTLSKFQEDTSKRFTA